MSVLRRHAGLLVVGVVAAGTLLLPGVGEACSQCLSGRSDETKLAYILTTVFLSILPPAIVGGAVWWLVRRVRLQERAREAASRPPREAVGGRTARAS